jgi:hypothetical protein
MMLEAPHGAELTWSSTTRGTRQFCLEVASDQKSSQQLKSESVLEPLVCF